MAAAAGPIEVFLPGDITFDSNRPVGGGGYGDLFKGEHGSKGSLALKRLRVRITPEDDPKVVKRAQNAWIVEAALWRKLLHPNVLTCIGLFHNSWDEVYLVSPWVDNGSLVNFVACHPRADRTQLLRDVAEGLSYLHENDIIHGDVKGVNALVTKDRRVALCDFGLSKLVSSVNTSTGGVGTLRWQSPELLMGGSRTKQADVYAFAITIYEILSGCVPFGQYELGAVVVAVLIRDERPPKEPQHSLNGEVYAGHWQLAETCWAKAAEYRPTMTEVVAKWPSSGSPPVLSTPAAAEERLPVIETSPSDIAIAERIFKRAQAYDSRYAKNQDAPDLEAAIRLYREVLPLHPSRHRERPNALYHLGRALNERYELHFEHSDLEEAVTLLHQAVQLYPLENPGRNATMNYLLPCLRKRDIFSSTPDYEAIITILREELRSRPPGDYAIPGILDHLGANLSERYTLTRNVSDLEEAVTLLRESVQLYVSGSSERAEPLVALAFTLHNRYELSRNTSDLEEAILCGREAINLCSPEDPRRATALNNLSYYLETSYTLNHKASDLNEAIQLCEEFIQANGTVHKHSAHVKERLENLLKRRPPTRTFKSKLTSKLKALKL